MRTYRAWTSILSEKELLNLSPYQVRQAETQNTAADSTAMDVRGIKIAIIIGRCPCGIVSFNRSVCV